MVLAVDADIDKGIGCLEMIATNNKLLVSVIVFDSYELVVTVSVLY